MKVVGRYSHLNGDEYMRVHHPHLLEEIETVIVKVDAERCRTKESKERGMVGRMLYSPVDLNAAFKAGFQARGWEQRRATFYVTADEALMRSVHELPPEQQKEAIEGVGQSPIMSYNQTDFVEEPHCRRGPIRQVRVRGTRPVRQAPELLRFRPD